MQRTLLLFFIFCCCFPAMLLSQTLSVSVFFQSDSSALAASEIATVERFVESLDTLMVSKITVHAYCDDIGNKAYNKTLSSKRAKTVFNLLYDISAQYTINYEGNGELPLAGNASIDEQRRNNRRAEITAFYALKPTLNRIVKWPVMEKSPAELLLEPDVVTPFPKKKPGEPARILSDDQKAGDKITLQNILFIGGRHTLLPESYEALEQLTKVLLEKKKYHIMILGHICCVTDGNDGIDFDTGYSNLSVARAKAIYTYLVQHGVSPDRLSYKGLRAKYPTGKGDKEDRRVEIEITKVINE